MNKYDGFTTKVDRQVVIHILVPTMNPPEYYIIFSADNLDVPKYLFTNLDDARKALHGPPQNVPYGTVGYVPYRLLYRYVLEYGDTDMCRELIEEGGGFYFQSTPDGGVRLT